VLLIAYMLPVLILAKQQAQPDEAVEHDHDHREHRVAADRRFARPGVHDRGDHHRFQTGHGECQHQRAERLA
jgi:hypothetical protein